MSRFGGNTLLRKHDKIAPFAETGLHMLKIENLRVVFNAGTVNEKPVFENLNFTVSPGDFVTIIGGNGAGKSTMLNIVAGVFPPQGGSVVLDGVNVSNMPEHRRAAYIGRVVQDPMKGTAADMEICENLSLAYRRGKRRGLARMITKPEIALYETALAQLGLGLETRLSTKVGLLSGGQRQALTLLMATLTKPKLLLLDEHTAALDPKTAAKVLEVTQNIISRDNLTALMVTHNMKDAIHFGNRLIMMNGGEVIYDVRGGEKAALKVADLLQKFHDASGADLDNDKMLLG